MAAVLAFVLFAPKIAKAGDCYSVENAKGDSQDVFLAGHCQPQSICDLAMKEDAKTQCIQSSECAQKFPSKPVCMLVGAGSMSPEKPASVNPQQAASPKEDNSRKLVVPKLNVKIPGLVFATESPVVKCEGTLKCISIPFLAQYIAAFFKILLGIGLVATALMIIYGGFLYVLGSTGLQVSDAKKKIVDALVGLAILIGAYLILMNINPQTISLKGIQIPTVSLGDQQFLEMASNTTTDTSGAPMSFMKVPGEGECPLVATAQNQSNKVKYYNGILATVKGGTYVERLKKVADIVTNCNVNLLDCGHTANTIIALAGIGETKCLLDENKICWDLEEFRKNVTGIYESKNSRYLRGLHKNGGCKGESLTMMDSQRLPPQQAVAKARLLLQDWEGSKYPDSVAEKLQPGDYIYTYTANDECNGLHSSIFIGWEGTSGRAKMVEGAMKQNPQYTIRCLKKACSWVDPKVGGYAPIVRIMRPKADRLRP